MNETIYIVTAREGAMCREAGLRSDQLDYYSAVVRVHNAGERETFWAWGFPAHGAGKKVVKRDSEMRKQ